MLGPFMATKRVRHVVPTVPPAVDWRGIETRRVEHAAGDGIFAQGDAANSVMYIERGSVRLSVVSSAGKEAVVAVLGPRCFFGEGCLAGQPARMATATAMTDCTALVVDKTEMVRQLHERPAFSDRFLVHMLARNIRVEEDLVDQLFNSSEKRLARTLLLLARYGKGDQPQRVLPAISQESLAEMVGTTRSRVNVFLKKFRKLGFIAYDADGLTVNPSLLAIVVHD
jgi:CRP/FNR family transcriptional regulator, cyclic AMP receptor protein